MEKLGIDTTMIIVQIVNFSLLFVILKKYLSAPLIQAIKNRESDLKKIEEEKGNIIVEQEKAKEEHTKIIANAHSKADEILIEARAQAEAEKKEILETANLQAKKIVSKAKLQEKIK